MNNIEQVIKQRQYLLGQIDELNIQVKELTRQLTEAIGVGQSISAGGYRVSVATRRTFKSDIAQQLLDKKRVSKKEQANLCRPTTLDGAKVKVMYPEIWEQSVVESDPYLRVSE